MSPCAGISKSRKSKNSADLGLKKIKADWVRICNIMFDFEAGNFTDKGMNMKLPAPLLMIPGPTPIPQDVLEALGRHPIPHRSPEFCSILKECHEGLKVLFATKNDVFIYAASGTGAMCAAIENLTNPDDRVLCLVIGNFGERFAKIASARGARVKILRSKIGDHINKADLEAELKLAKEQNAPYKLVTLTHSETSTGAANDIKTLCQIIHQYDALSIVDGVTSLCCMECKMDEWGIDVLVSGSQKGFMLPPGLAFLAASPRAFEVAKETKYKSFYFDFEAHKKSLQKDTTPYTPAVTMVFGLHEALKMLLEIGLENLNHAHKRHALALRKAIRAMGLKLLVEEDFKASHAVCAIYPPEGIAVADIRAGLKKQNIIIANGQGELEGKIFRIGTLGYIQDSDLIHTISVLEQTLLELGYSFVPYSGVQALKAALK